MRPPKTILTIWGAGSSRKIASDLVVRGRRLDEGRVGAGLDHGLGPLERGVEAEHRTRVGPGDDLEIAVPPRVDRGPDLGEHLRQGHDVLAVEMAAALREDLVLDLEPGRAGALQH